MKHLLETERLYFREFTIDDAQLIVDLNSDPRVTKYTEHGPIKSIAEAEKKLKTDLLLQYPNKLGRWAVHLKSNDEFIGWCGLKYVEKENAVTLGYRFFFKHRNKGYATESAKAALNYGTQVLQLKNIIAKAAKENTASINVLKKLGMVYLKDDMCAHDPAEVYVFESDKL
ncbi:MAG: GNAT family N-acetyltransferase [Bacteroidia bacterium]